MTKWEYLMLSANGIYGSPAKLSQVLSRLKIAMPALSPKDAKLDKDCIKIPNGALFFDVLDALGADGWEAVGVSATMPGSMTLFRRPIG